jgi:hypothetical protein
LLFPRRGAARERPVPLAARDRGAVPKPVVVESIDKYGIYRVPCGCWLHAGYSWIIEGRDRGGKGVSRILEEFCGDVSAAGTEGTHSGRVIRGVLCPIYRRRNAGRKQQTVFQCRCGVYDRSSHWGSKWGPTR